MRSLIIFKPDGVRDDVLLYAQQQVAAAGYTVQFDVLQVPDLAKVQAHLEPLRLKYSQEIFERNVAYYMSGPLRLWVVEGDSQIFVNLRKIVGSTEPVSADAQSLRGKFSTDSYVQAKAEQRALHNYVHTSDAECAASELCIWGF